MSDRIIDRTNSMGAIYNKLLEKAMEDGVITPDEEAILQKAKELIYNYKDFADKALEDGIVTVKEHTDLLQLQGKLLSGVEEVADDDNHISDDEALLLNTLKQSLKSI